MNQQQEWQISHVTHITILEGDNWIPLDMPNRYLVMVGKIINKEGVMKALGLQNIASLKTESGHIYDFIIEGWRHLYKETTCKVEDLLIQNPASICREEATAIEKMLAERGSRYGAFSGHAFITQNLKDAMKNSPNWDNLNVSQKETLEMVAHKIGRILNGDPNYLDSWVDIVGYTQLIVDQLNGKNT